jgi:uncharacterized membrane protein YoaK (UPF0700 family)
MADTGGPTTNLLLVGSSLSFIAGFADASTFVGADGIFCAHVTGNFVVLAADFARHARADEWLKLATFPIFVVAVLAATHVHRRLSGLSSTSSGRSTRALLAVNACLFGLAAIVPFVTATSVAGLGRSVVVTLLVAAMGIQNAIHRVRPTLGPMTTVMTGNVTGWLVDKLIPGPPESASKHRHVAFVIAAFAAGCILGGFGVHGLGFGALAVPMIVTLVARSQIR